MRNSRHRRLASRFVSIAAVAMSAVLASGTMPIQSSLLLVGTVAVPGAALPDTFKTDKDIQDYIAALTAGAATNDASAATSKSIATLKVALAKAPDAMDGAAKLAKDAKTAQATAKAATPPDQAKIEAANKDVEAKNKQIKDLDAAIRAADPAIKAFFGNLDKGILPIKGLDPSKILKVLNGDADLLAASDAISTLTPAVPFLTLYRSGDDWVVPQTTIDAITAKYKALYLVDPIWGEAPKFESGGTWTTLDADVKYAETNLPQLIEKISRHIPARLIYIEQIAGLVGRNPVKSGRMAIDRREAEKLVVSNLLTLIPALDTYGKSKNPVPIDGKDVDAIRTSLPGYQVDIAGLDLAILGDRTKNEERVVSFYYFRDVQRVLHALRSNVKETTFLTPTTTLASLRQQIIGQDFDLQAKMAVLSDKQQKLLSLRAQEPSLKAKIDAAQAKADQAQDAVDSSDRKLIRLKSQQTAASDALTKAEKVYEDAKSDATTHANDSTKTEAWRAHQAKLDQAAIEAAEQKADSAKKVKQSADLAVDLETNRNTTLATDRNTANSDLTDAKKALTDSKESQGTLDSDIREAAIAVATNREAGAKLTAQDNGLFADIRDNAPFLHAPADPTSGDPLERVDFIAFKDKSRMLLRGLPSDLHVVEEILGAFDHPEPQAKLTLRVLEVNVINDQAGYGARNYNNAFSKIQSVLRRVREQTTATETLLRDAINQRVRIREYMAHEPSLQAGVSISPEQTALLKRFSFYQPEALGALGAPGVNATAEEVAFAVRNIPDPARTTTLGEALLVLMLASHSEQSEVSRIFLSKLPKYFKSRKFQVAGADETNLFPGSRRVMGIDGYEYQNPLGLSPQQMELISAIQRRTVINMVEEMRANGVALAKPGIGEDEKQRLCRELKPRYNFLCSQFSLDEEKLKHIFETPDYDDAKFLAFVAQFPRSEVNARIAAADKLLKDVIQRVEDDVTGLLVEPAMDEIRGILQRDRLEVGMLTTTDILATNRFPARVDAGATAQVAMGETNDVLTATQQLAALALSTKTNDIYKIFKDLKSNTNEPPREIYGIGSGGLFNVTPVFDPSGQSMRFTFDYVTANRIQEPNGATDPKLPRVERHSINTEVELSTFEIRNISEFVSNTKLGLARHQWGGIPILNDVPVLKELPIIGWFVRREGRAAVSQHSLVFAQSTVYPTIDDMLTLLTPISSRVIYGGK